MAAAHVFLESAMSGMRLNMFAKLVPRISDPETKKAAEDFCERMRALVEKRNHVVHGLWGWQVDWKKNIGIPACCFSKGHAKDVLATEIADLVQRAAGESLEIHKVTSALMGTSCDIASDQRPEYMFSDGPPVQGRLPEFL